MNQKLKTYSKDIDRSNLSNKQINILIIKNKQKLWN